MGGKLRVLVAGAGLFGREHLARLARMADVAVAGVADIDLAAAQQAAATCGAETAGPDFVAMLGATRPDAAVIASPGATHLPFALAALQAGIPALLEKPVGRDAAEARRLAAAEAVSRGFILPGHVLRFSRQHRRLRDIVQAPDFGPIHSFSSRRHRDEAHAVRYADVDPVTMTMVHDIDLALWITGASADSVFALRRPSGQARSDTRILATGRGGAIWQLSAAWTFRGEATPPDRVEIVGGNGSVEFEAGVAIRRFGAEAGRIDLAAAPEDQLAEELAYFLDCVRRGSRPGRVTLHDACDGLAVADAVLASLGSGTPERVSRG